MNGDGWVCDECGDTIVVPGVDRFVMNGHTPPPEGWFLLYRATPGVGTCDDRWEFCSFWCVGQAARKKDAEHNYELRQALEAK